MDEYVTTNGLDVAEEQESEISPNSRKEISSPVSHLNLKDARVSAIVWASGFRYDFDWIKVPVFDDGGEPVHRRGVTQLSGIYFLGLRWLYKRNRLFSFAPDPRKTPPI